MNHLPKHPILPFLLLTLAVGLAVLSCKSTTEQTAEQQKPALENDKAAPNSAPVVNSNQSELLKTIVGAAGEGFFRGLNFGDPIDKIKATEKFELFEDSTDHVGFTYETENFEAVDVLYYLDKNQTIKNIRVDAYLNSPLAVRGLQDQFETYLSGRFRNEKKEGKTTIWKGANNVYITLEDVSKGKDYGLRLRMGPKITMNS